jgi:hypothetical protein
MFIKLRNNCNLGVNVFLFICKIYLFRYFARRNKSRNISEMGWYSQVPPQPLTTQVKRLYSIKTMKKKYVFNNGIKGLQCKVVL